ncbi:hypothetical protein ILUMI_11755 [Ignelater luminosus]|uniref:Peptidase aspartic putative domain-containing protein n=1 Tax=Ignelater luminosus TaxID=2038154 RepID=A0A8K0GDM5_IGNLU|nr:hypothetical protein ILUMI_11755 [Ignelater luminosus]
MFESLLEFLKYEMEGDQKIPMVLDGFGLTMSLSPRVEQNKGKTNNTDRLKDCKETIQREVPTAAGLLTTVEELRLYNIYLSDVNTDGAIEVLLGKDLVGSLLTGNRKEVRNGLIAFQTKLGWTLIGRVSEDANSCKRLSVLTDPSEKLSKIELEATTHQHFLDSVRINGEGHIEVRPPVIKNHPPLSTNYGLAIKRMNSTNKKLNRIIEKVTEELGDESCRYLPPNRHVMKLGSSTPIRLVFDALTRDHTNRNSVSLNEYLEKGPNLIEKIPAILACFRMNRLDIVANIWRKSRILQRIETS